MITLSILVFMLFLCAAIFLKPKWGIYYLVFYVFFMGSAVVGENFQKASVITFLPRLFGGTYDVAVISLFLRTVLVRTGRCRAPNFLGWVVLLFVMGTIAAILHDVKMSCYLWQMRRSALYFLMPLAFINLKVPEKFYRGILKMIFICFLIQIPIVIFQAAKFLGAGGFGADFISGSLATGQHGLAYLSLMVILTVTHLYIQKAVGLATLLVGFLGLVPLIAANSRASWVFFAAILGLTFFSKAWIRTLVRSFSLWLMLAIVLASAIPFADTLFSRMGMDEQFTVRGVFTKEFFKKFIEHDSKEESEEKKNKEKKIYGIINMNEILKQYPYGQIMGIGIGAYARSDTAQIYGVIPQLRGTGEKTGSSESYQLAYTLAEFGWLGAGIILLMYVLILMFLRRTIRRETEPYWKGINKGFSGFTFLMLLSVFYRFAWYNDTLITFLYWLMYAAVFTRSCRERKPLDVAGESSYREDHGELALQRFRR